MEEKQKSSSTENSIAQAYAAYMIALAARKRVPDTPDETQQEAWRENIAEKRKPGTV